TAPLLPAHPPGPDRARDRAREDGASPQGRAHSEAEVGAVRFPLRWPERLYGLVLLTYSRDFRSRYEHEMRLVFRDLLRDEDFSRWRLARMIVADLVAGVTTAERLPSGDLVKNSVLYGTLIVAFSIAARAW